MAVPAWMENITLRVASEPYHTEAAMQSLLMQPKVLMDMRIITEQDTNEMCIVTLKSGREQHASADVRALCLECLQTMRAEKDPRPSAVVTTAGLRSFVPCLTVDVKGQRVYAFRAEAHALFLVATDEAHRSIATDMIASWGKAHSYGGVCSFCGAAGRFRKCPCKATHYCSAKCQNQHWKAHKTVCSHVQR